MKEKSMYSSVIFEKAHETPCHPSPHGSPPTEIHPRSGGEPREVCKLFIAETGGTCRKQRNNYHRLPMTCFEKLPTFKLNKFKVKQNYAPMTIV